MTILLRKVGGELFAVLVASAVLLAFPARAVAVFGWHSLGQAEFHPRCVSVSPNDPRRIFVGGDFLLASKDGGATWMVKSNVPSVNCIVFAPDGQLGFAGTWGHGIYRTTDGGVSWSEKPVGVGNKVILAVSLSHRDPQRFYYGAEDGLHFSDDEGEMWSCLGQTVGISAVGCHPFETNIIYIGTWTGLWKSADGGTNWTLLTVGTVPSTEGALGFAFDSQDTNTVYAVFQGYGVWVSRDAGAVWQQIKPQFEGFTVASHPAISGRVYAVGGWATPSQANDFGAGGWKELSTGWPRFFVRGIAPAGDPDGGVYAASEQGGILRWSPLTASNLVVEPPAISIPYGGWATPTVQVQTEAGWVALMPQQVSWTSSNPGVAWADKAGVLQGESPGLATLTASFQSVSANIPVTVAPPRLPTPPGIDLDVTYINRTPMYSPYKLDYIGGKGYVRASNAQARRWPTNGELVRFTAHVRNKGTVTSPPFEYKWLVDGIEQDEGTLPGLAPRQEAIAIYSWPWAHTLEGERLIGHHTIRFTVDPSNLLAETFETNNTLEDATEAYSIQFCIPMDTYVLYNVPVRNGDPFSAEDWIQKQAKEMNAVLQRSVYAVTPSGAVGRVRINSIDTDPMLNWNPSIDGHWYFTGEVRNPGGYYDSTADVDYGLVHELAHQVGLIDLYSFDAGGVEIQATN